MNLVLLATQVTAMLALVAPFAPLRVPRVPPMTPTLSRSALIRLTASAETSTFGPPTDEDRKRLQDACPSPLLQPREVITTVMNSIHRASWDNPRPFFGFEVLNRFLSPSHQYPVELELRGNKATPQSLSRYLRQPHKRELLAWNEYRWDGDLQLMAESREAFQQISVRSGSDAAWTSVRLMLVRVEPTSHPHSQWMLDAVFVSEPDNTPGVSETLPPAATAALIGTADGAAAAWAAGGDAWEAVFTSPLDTPLDESEQQRLFDAFDIDRSGTISRQEFRQVVADLGLAIPSDELTQLVREADVDQSGELDFDEFSSLLGKAVEGGATVAGRFASEVSKASRDMYTESPRQVVETVMKALRNSDDPYPLHGAEVAVRYCSPTNKASQLSPQAFASYLREPWYEILTEWDEMQVDAVEEEDVEAFLAERWEQLRLNVAEVDTLVRRSDDSSWTIVNFRMSRHNGRWLMDSLSIN